jgi:serine phosphatase RsbU (regulator of sigma subunit)
MNLRGRITLFVCISILAMSGGMRLVSMLREQDAEARYAAALETGARNTWSGLTEIVLRRLDDLAPALVQDPAVATALAKQDDTALRAAMERIIAVASGNRAPPMVEVVGADGQLRFSSENAAAPLVATRELLGRRDTPIVPEARGVTVAANGETVMAVVQPVMNDDGRIGVVAVFTGLETALGDFAKAADASVYMMRGTQGAPIAGLDTARRLDVVSVALPDQPVGRLKRSGKTLEVVHFPVPDLARADDLAVVVVRDVTAAARRDALVRMVSEGLTIGSFALFLAFLYWYMRVSFRPLNTVIRVLNALSRGNTRVALRLKPGNDEIGRLAGTVETFRRGQEAQGKLMSLKQELELAHNIQASFLSTDFPRLDTLEIFATMQPAKEVGGDFYDFFELPGGRYGVVVADVSGKGVGAAMFMAVARTVIRSTARVIADPGDCLSQANDLLARENKAQMFVTVFYAVLDTRTGVVTYANAGHNPPIRLAGERAPVMLKSNGDMALGILEGLSYETEELSLAPGETLLLYTDGVTEAFNDFQEAFGEKRLFGSLSTLGRADVVTIIDALVTDVKTFTAGAPRSDDLTCLALCYRPAAAADLVSSTTL